MEGAYEGGFESEAEAELERLLRRVDEAVYEAPPGSGTVTFPPQFIFPSNTRQVVINGYAKNSDSFPARDAQGNIQNGLLGGLAQNIINRFGTATQVNRLRFVGHTDSSGSLEFNLDMGLKRARNIRQGLQRIIEAGTVLSSSFIMPAFEQCSAGASRPASTTNPAENRRVEIFLET
jgi:hypothetical protein